MTAMTATTAPSTFTTAGTTTRPDRTPPVARELAPTRRGVGRVGLRAGLVAAAATTAVAAVADAAGVPLEIGGEAIPLAGFAQVTLMCVALGVGIAAFLARRARQPERTWLRTAGALTALSLVPDLTADATTATKLVLMLTHVVAAAVVVPAVAAHLRDRS